MKRIHLLENKYSLKKLGAGSDLLSLVLLKYSDKISPYTFTDYSPMILNLLWQNVLLNFSEDQLDVIDWKSCILFTIILFSFETNENWRIRLESIFNGEK